MMKLRLMRNLRGLLQKISPQIISGYKRFDGVLLKQTRISNSTYIDNKQNFKIEDNVFIGHHNFLEASNGLTIEEGCQITNFITITTHSSHDAIRLYGKNYGGSEMIGYQKGEVFIGNPAKVIGDTRTKDLKTLEKHPELKNNYNEWTKF